VLAGLLAVWLISWVFTLFGRLQHSGTMDLRNAIGKNGRVYLTIPKGGTGKVEVEVQGGLNVLDAVSEDGAEDQVGPAGDGRQGERRHAGGPEDGLRPAVPGPGEDSV